MSDAETADLLRLIREAPQGTFKLYRGTENEPEVEQSMANLAQLSDRIQCARSANCLIEVISLRLQHMDLWLRVFYENIPHDGQRQREFGRLLRQCFDAGLTKSLYDRVHAFNDHRILAIHGFVLGQTTYDELAAVVEESDGLAEALVEFVLLNCGEIVTAEFENQPHQRGDAVYNVPAMIQQLRSSPSI